MAKKSKKVFTVIPVNGVDIEFDTSEDLINAYINKLEELELLKATSVDLEGELLRSSGVSPIDLKLIELVTKGDQKALAYLQFKYAKEEVQIPESELVSYVIPTYDLNLDAIKVEKILNSFSPSIRDKIKSEVIQKWDEVSLTKLNSDVNNYAVLKNHISSGIFDEAVKLFPEFNAKSSSLVCAYDKYNTCKEVAEYALKESLEEEESEIKEVTSRESAKVLPVATDVVKVTAFIQNDPVQKEIVKPGVSTFARSKGSVVSNIPTVEITNLSPVHSKTVIVSSEASKVVKKTPPVGLKSQKGVQVNVPTSEVELVSTLFKRGDIEAQNALSNFFHKEIMAYLNNKN